MEKMFPIAWKNGCLFVPPIWSGFAGCRKKDVLSWQGPILQSIALIQGRRDFPEVS
jgi:hypothetical protein